MQTNKRYWLKGGVIVAVMFFAVELWLLSIQYCTYYTGTSEFNNIRHACPQGFSVIIKSLNFILDGHLIIGLYLVLIVVGGFSIGSLLGWLYSLINRKITKSK